MACEDEPVSGDDIRRAASVIAVRAGDDAPEILVVERSGRSRFLPGYVAFPGGAVDPDDADLAGRWFGERVEAVRAAAVREFVEEVGLAVTGAGVRPVPDGAGVGAVDLDPPAPDRLVEIARWVAPEDVPVRFDARFFALTVDQGVDPTPDGTETAAAWWISPSALLREWSAGDRRLYWPTWLTIDRLAACATVEELLALRIETREPDDDEVAAMPPSVFWQDR